ncbi:MAG: hypothetical protein GEU73_05025 [Chloroflexi bacterium]|nr:hypothetical protein [Chloroflexota bacterium]
MRHPDSLQSDVERAAEVLKLIGTDYRDLYFASHERPYRSPGIDTGGARSAKGSHGDETQDAALSQGYLRSKLKRALGKLYGGRSHGLLKKIDLLHAEMNALTETDEDDFDRPLRSIVEGQEASPVDNLLAPKYREARELEQEIGRTEKRRRKLAREIANLERRKDAEAVVEARGYEKKRWLA